MSDLGRYLTSVLRHRAEKLGLKMKPDGYVLVRDILSLTEKTRGGWKVNTHTLEDVLVAVKRDSKQRMSVRGEGMATEIRANQGHSLKNINDEHLLKRINSPDELPIPGLCIHGTYYKFLSSILEHGLKSMKRRMVHFSTQEFQNETMISGMRNNCQVLIYLDVDRALQDGVKIYLSDNQVALVSDEVSTKYFKKVCDANTGRKIDLKERR